ncbi:MAG TPA: hypothetical protein VGI79_03125 [Caulobacteraceae bacterium]
MTAASPPIDDFDPAERRALELLALLNIALFLLEAATGMMLGSVALLADAVNFMDRAGLFGLAAIAVGWSARDRGWARLAQGAAMGLVGVCALGQIISRFLYGGVPAAVGLGAVALVAMAANLYIGWRQSRAKIDVGVAPGLPRRARREAQLILAMVFAAGLVAATRSAWPDMIVGAVIAFFSLRAAYRTLAAGGRDVFARK